MTAQEQLYLEDFAPGTVYPGQVRRLGERQFRMFAEITGDAHPIHYDAQYAARSTFGSCVAHGLLVAAVGALGATPVSPLLEESMVAFVEQGGKFLRPVLLGDEIRTEFEVESVAAKPATGLGLVRFIVRVYGRDGELAMRGYHVYLFRSRGGAPK